MTFRLDILNQVIKFHTRRSHQLGNKCNLSWLRIFISFKDYLLDIVRYFKLFIGRMVCSWVKLSIFLLSRPQVFENQFIHSSLVYIRIKCTNCKNSWGLDNLLRSASNTHISFCHALIKSDRSILCDGFMGTTYRERLLLILMYLGGSNWRLATILHLSKYKMYLLLARIVINSM